ncbi:MAG TPA: hypothetical protein VGS07_01965 [Thermoanaerobaculia bacterium]|jgi:hypothetical protein|nr:hypothetical protein [Thermoanaerobaculia bacterium]
MAEDNRGDRGLNGEATNPLLAVLERVRSVLDRERAAAPAFCAELLALPPETALERIRQEPRFQSWGLCELLLAKAESEAAEHFASLALAGAERLDPSRHAAAVVEDLKARAWAAAGEARRRGGDLAGAEEALRAAASCLSHGTGDLLVEARLLEFEATVRRVQKRYKEAAAVLKLAAARYRETGETERLERALAEREDVLQAAMRSIS